MKRSVAGAPLPRKGQPIVARDFDAWCELGCPVRVTFGGPSSGPTGQETLAQGSTLGKHPPHDGALKGRKKHRPVRALDKYKRNLCYVLVPQSLSRVILHLIFSTKDRSPALADEALRCDLHAYLAATARDLGCPAIRVGGVADHVHVVCCLARTVSVANLVAKLKMGSSRMLKAKSGTRFQWQNGYGAFSVSESALGNVVEYVANQALHHRRLSFQEEYRVFLRRHGVEFDERYVWD